MKKPRRIVLSLLFLSPVLGELLSGSNPPLQFFHPVAFVLLTLFYGGGAVLIREARARWGLHWPVIFLLIAYAILEEGTMMQSFFNHNHVDLQHMSRYGMFLGVQWPWTFAMFYFHSTVSTIIPIVIIDLIWPEYRDKALLGRCGLIVISLGVAAVTLFMMLVIWHQQQGLPDPYVPNPFMLIGSVALVGALILTAWFLRGQSVTTDLFPLAPPWLFGVLGLLSTPLNLGVPFGLATHGAPGLVTVAVQLAMFALILFFVLFQLCHIDLTNRHLVSIVMGALLFFILTTPLQEFGATNNPDPTRGMLAVGLAMLAFLIWWRRRVLRGSAGDRRA